MMKTAAVDICSIHTAAVTKEYDSSCIGGCGSGLKFSNRGYGMRCDSQHEALQGERNEIRTFVGNDIL